MLSTHSKKFVGPADTEKTFSTNVEVKQEVMAQTADYSGLVGTKTVHIEELEDIE